jgi:hypothetical protein
LITENVAYLEIKNQEELSWDNLSGSTVLANAKAKLSGAAQSAGAQTGSSSRVIQVQYNPTSLKFSGRTQKKEDSKQVEAQRQNIPTIPAWGVLSMAVDLVFTAASVTDTSVADRMNDLLRMMQKSKKKEIVFSWADLVVEGKVTYLSGEYQSFYPSGLPKAGKVSLRIEAEAEPKKIEKKIEKMVKES